MVPGDKDDCLSYQITNGGFNKNKVKQDKIMSTGMFEF